MEEDNIVSCQPGNENVVNHDINDAKMVYNTVREVEQTSQILIKRVPIDNKSLFLSKYPRLLDDSEYYSTCCRTRGP